MIFIFLNNNEKKVKHIQGFSLLAIFSARIYKHFLHIFLSSLVYNEEKAENVEARKVNSLNVIMVRYHVFLSTHFSHPHLVWEKRFTKVLKNLQLVYLTYS